MSVDPNLLKSNIHTSYYNAFFLLRMPIHINGHPAEIGKSGQMLTLNSRLPYLGITFDSLFNDVSAVVKKYGLSEMGNYWCEDVPLFEVKHSTPDDAMRQFICSAEKVQNELASKISAQLAEKQLSSDPSTSHPRLPVVVHTEVFLLTPDPINKDSDLVQVTSENLSTCLSLLKESEVFDFRSLFKTHKIKSRKDHGPPTLSQLLTELYEVVEWYQFGIHLGVLVSDLEEIKCENDKVRERRREMLSAWLRRSLDPTWVAIVNALTTIGRRNLAHKLSLKYGVPTPSVTAEKPVAVAKKKHNPIQKKLCSQINQMKITVETNDTELVITKQAASEAQNARMLAKGRLIEVRKKAVEVQTKVTMRIKKSIEIQKQLQLKESELTALQALHETEKAKYQGLIDNKNEEIQKLRQGLQEIQIELAAEKEEAHSVRKQLQQATQDLTHKSARLQELEWARQKLETLLDSERKRVDQLLMQVTSASNSQQRNREIENQLSAAKQELEAKTKEMDILKQTIAHRDGEVKGLFTQIQSQEALLQRLLTQPVQTTKPDVARELGIEEEMQRLTMEVSELRTKLIEAEDEKQEAQRQLQAGQLETRLLRDFMSEIKPNPPPIPPKPARKPTQKPARKLALSESQLLNSQFQLKWRRTADLPLAMSRPQIVQIDNTTYCGGGLTDGDVEDDRQVFQYSDERNEWTALPPCPTRNHALVELNEKLTSIGGVEHDAPGCTPTNSVYVLEDLQWRKTMPPLATARFQASAITYDSHAIVCGGVTSYTSLKQHTCTSTVEVYSSDTNQWTMSSPLPFALRSMSIAIVKDMCYVIGGQDHEYTLNVAACAPLSVLTRSAEGHQAGTSQPSPSSAVWEVLPSCPHYCSTAAQLGGCVLALGGAIPTVGTTDIHLYSRSSNYWRRVTGAKLPIASYYAATTTLPSGDIMLIGGVENPDSRLNTVYIASIHSTSQ